MPERRLYLSLSKMPMANFGFETYHPGAQIAYLRPGESIRTTYQTIWAGGDASAGGATGKLKW